MDYKGRIDAAKILNSLEIKTQVLIRTKAIETFARAIAPVDEGDLKASIGSRMESRSGVKRDRPVGVVFTNATSTNSKGVVSGYGSPQEFGTTFGRGSYFLRRAAGAP